MVDPTLRMIVIVGPTATGKTRLAVEVAHRLGTEIVSADARQVYRGLDIGSGKDLEEYARPEPPVAHHLIDVADPRRPYSLFEYQRDFYDVVRAKVAEPAWADGLPLVVVGGSGLYVEAVLSGYRIANVPENVALRASLMRHDRDVLDRMLRRSDAELWSRTDRSSKKRIVRALEIAAHARHVPVRYSDPPPVALDPIVFGIDLPRDALRDRIDARLDAGLAAGLIDEVRRLLDSGVSVARMEQLGLEYREVTAHLLGHKSEERMIADLRRGILQLAKRQRTRFRGFPRRGIDIRWIDPDDADRVLGTLAAAGPASGGSRFFRDPGARD